MNSTAAGSPWRRALASCCSSALLFGQVAQDTYKKGLSSHQHRCHRDRQRHRVTARMAAFEHAVFRRRCRQARQLGAGVVPCAAGLGHQGAEREPVQVRRRIAEQARGGRIARDQDAVRVDRNDGVGGIVEDGLEARFAVAQARGAVRYLFLNDGTLAADEQHQRAQHPRHQQSGREHHPADGAGLGLHVGGRRPEAHLVAASGEIQANPVLVALP
jgi:hypothetical protein